MTYKACDEGPSTALTVEFLGIPGSGKSWLNQRMLERLRCSANAVALDRSQMWSMRFGTDARKRAFQLATVWRQRQFLLFALPRLARDMGTTGTKGHSARQLLSALMVAHISRRWSGSPCVVGLDESMLQRSDMLFSHSPHPVDSAMVRQFVGYTPKSDIVVWLTTAGETAMSRARARPHGLPRRLQHMSESDVLDHFLRLHELFGCCVNHIRRDCKDVIVLAMDTTDKERATAFCDSTLVPTVSAALRRRT